MKNKFLILTLIFASVYCSAQAQTSLAPHKWYSVVKMPLSPDGTLPVSGNRDKEYSIPTSVPNDAKEILIYVTVRNAGSVNQLASHFKIYTRSAQREFAKYFSWEPAGGPHVSYNSDNMWLPITNERKIRCTRETGDGGVAAVNSSISIIGYR